MQQPLLVEPSASSGRPTASQTHLSQYRSLDRRALRRFVAIALVCALAVVAFVVLMTLQVGGARGSDRIDDFSELGAAMIGGAVCLARSRGIGIVRVRRAWRYIGLGAICWGLGQAVWTWYDVVRNVAVPFPSLADAGFLLAVPLLLIGVLHFPAVGEDSLSRTRFILDGMILGGSLLAVSWGTVLGATFHSSGGSIPAEVIALAYPVGDVATVTVGLSLLAHTGRRYRVPLAIVILGMLSLAISDSAFVYLEQTTSYTAGNALDGGWIGGFLLLGLASLWSLRRPAHSSEERQRRSWWQVGLPYVMLTFGVGFIVAKYLRDHRLDSFLIVDGLVVLLVVFVRQVIILVEQSRLAGRLETAVQTLQSNEALLSFQALHDPLTGLGNRVLFSERIEAARGREHDRGQMLAVLLCDLDRFKDINDTLGHTVGDAILTAVARRLLVAVRDGDSVARVGGDEFAVVLGDVASAEQASAVASRIVESMRVAFDVAAKDCYLHISVGIAMCPLDEVTVEEILRKADVALYAAKNAGGDSHRFYEPQMGEAHFDRLQFQTELALAPDSDQFVIEYEPIVSLASGRPIGVEALLRWNHPVRGLLAPKDFLETAERSGAIVTVGKWVLDQAVCQLRAWREQHLASGLWMSVNLSPSQLVGGEILTAIVDSLENHGIDAGSLCLELTENALVEQGEAGVELLAALRALGVRIAIDDFGTGYSSLSYLKNLPLDSLKIDRSFVTDLGSDAYQGLIIESVVRLAHARGIEVVAEGIVSDRQLSLLRDLGCDLGQGFFWTRSLGARQFGAWLAQQAREVAVPPGWSGTGTEG